MRARRGERRISGGGAGDGGTSVSFLCNRSTPIFHHAVVILHRVYIRALIQRVYRPNLPPIVLDFSTLALPVGRTNGIREDPNGSSSPIHFEDFLRRDRGEESPGELLVIV